MRSRKSAPPASSPSPRAPEGGWRRLGRIVALAGVLLAPGALPASEIEGKVNLLPAPATTNPVTNQRYNLAGPAAPVPKSGVANVDGAFMPNPRVAVVYLEGDLPAPATPPAPNPRIEQKGQVFIPAFLPIPVGTKVDFPNLDDFYHSVFSNSLAKRFDLGRYSSKETPPPVLFDKPGLVILWCDIHTNMRGLILVVPTPYFVVTDKDGRYRLPDVPPGKYKLKVWKDSNTTLEREVVIPATGTLNVDFP
jgi:plastocyanin